jgi:predicted MFS family arabinose efflux permease
MHSREVLSKFEPQTHSLSKSRSEGALDWLNFFLADVQTGVGPFLAIYLTATRKWNPAQVGAAMAAQGLAGIVAQSPAGALVDATTKKRGLLAIGVLFVAAASVAVVHLPGFIPIIVTLAIVGSAGALLPITVAAISLGIARQERLASRIGRNEAFNHAGNVAFALLAGVVGTYLSQASIFYAAAFVSGLTLLCILALRPQDIDHHAARGQVPRAINGQFPAQKSPSSWRELLKNRHILTFAVAIILFHFANAAMLPLVGELLSKDRPQQSSFFMSASILVAQAVMVPTALLTAKAANKWGSKGPFLVAFAVLTLRGSLYTWGSGSFYLLLVQSLDGIGAAIFGVLWVTVAADLSRGSGHFNILQGMIQTCLGLGAMLSNFVAGLVVKRYGFNTGFLMLATIAVLGLMVYWFSMPETRGGLENSVPKRSVEA